MKRYPFKWHQLEDGICGGCWCFTGKTEEIEFKHSTYVAPVCKSTTRIGGFECTKGTTPKEREAARKRVEKKKVSLDKQLNLPS